MRWSRSASARRSRADSLGPEVAHLLVVGGLEGFHAGERMHRVLGVLHPMREQARECGDVAIDGAGRDAGIEPASSQPIDIALADVGEPLVEQRLPCRLQAPQRRRTVLQSSKGVLTVGAFDVLAKRRAARRRSLRGWRKCTVSADSASPVKKGPWTTPAAHVRNFYGLPVRALGARRVRKAP